MNKIQRVHTQRLLGGTEKTAILTVIVTQK